MAIPISQKKELVAVFNFGETLDGEEEDNLQMLLHETLLTNSQYAPYMVHCEFVFYQVLEQMAFSEIVTHEAIKSLVRASMLPMIFTRPQPFFYIVIPPLESTIAALVLMKIYTMTKRNGLRSCAEGNTSIKGKTSRCTILSRWNCFCMDLSSQFGL